MENGKDSGLHGCFKSCNSIYANIRRNRGELAEGWYDPSTLHKAQQSADSAQDDYSSSTTRPEPAAATASTSGNATTQDAGEDDSDSDDSVGPSLPGQDDRSRRKRTGPSIPNMQDLELKRGTIICGAPRYAFLLTLYLELEAEDGLARRDDIRYDRKMDRKAQKDALDELVPRAEAGTRERQLEKKKEVNEKMRSFREKSPGAAEVPDTELMGGGDGVGEFKKMKEEFERKKSERELRKEEILRARMEERDERLSEYRAKEEGTMAMLQALAKQRFG